VRILAVIYPLAGGRAGASSGIAVLLGCAVLAQGPTLQTYTINNSGDAVSMIGDVDTDGVSDLAIVRVVAGSGARVEVLSTRSGALLHNFIPPVGAFYGEAIWMGDVNGDGHADVAYNQVGPPGTGYLTIRSGATGALIHQIVHTGPYGLLMRGVGDVNNDGRCDFLLSDQGATVAGMLEAGRVDLVDGFTLQVIRSHNGTAPHQKMYGVGLNGDADGDGVRDYVLNTAYYRGISGASGSLVFNIPRLSYSYRFVTVGDTNADGFDDIVTYDEGNPPYTSYIQSALLAGPSYSQTLWSHTFLWSSPGPVLYSRPIARVGDMDGDGHDEFGFLSGNVGVATTMLSGRTRVPWFEIPLGANMSIAEVGGPGDVDGDGHPEYFAYALLPGGAFEFRLISGAPPGVTALGAGCPDQTGTIPRIGVGIGARLGQTMSVNLSKANPNLLGAILAGGYSAQTWNGTPLPFDLGFVGMPGCSWQVSGDNPMTLATSGVNGTKHHATFELTVPQTPQLLGAALHWQWLVLEPSPGGLTGSVTAAMRTTIVQ
jgi:hypothetical protein